MGNKVSVQNGPNKETLPSSFTYARAKSAFITPFGKFEFTRIPFGVRNAPAMFQRLMEVVLNSLEYMSSPYIDDVLVFSKSWEEHLQHIELVLTRLQKNGLTVKPSKFEWKKQSLEYLGFHIGKGVISVPEARVEALENFKLHITKKDVKSFLGSNSYYRRFISNCSTLTNPLHNVTKKTAPDKVVWSGELLETFRFLRINVYYMYLCNMMCLHCKLMRRVDISGVLSVCRDGHVLLPQTPG